MIGCVGLFAKCSLQTPPPRWEFGGGGGYAERRFDVGICGVQSKPCRMVMFVSGWWLVWLKGGARKGEIGGDGSCQGRKRDIECWLAR